jgi:hypothetical protein
MSQSFEGSDKDLLILLQPEIDTVSRINIDRFEYEVLIPIIERI